MFFNGMRLKLRCDHCLHPRPGRIHYGCASVNLRPHSKGEIGRGEPFRLSSGLSDKDNETPNLKSCPGVSPLTMVLRYLRI